MTQTQQPQAFFIGLDEEKESSIGVRETPVEQTAIQKATKDLRKQLKDLPGVTGVTTIKVKNSQTPIIKLRVKKEWIKWSPLPSLFTEVSISENSSEEVLAQFEMQPTSENLAPFTVQIAKHVISIPSLNPPTNKIGVSKLAYSPARKNRKTPVKKTESTEESATMEPKA